MKIVIAGAGEVGFHLAKLLSNESHAIYLIDEDPDQLKHADKYLDVITIRGDATSISVLKKVNIVEADLIIGVTESQNTNLTIAALSKKLGVKKTIARINNPEFLNTKEINFKEVGIDYMISPEELAAEEIQMLLDDTTVNDKIAFEKGVFNVIGINLPEYSSLVGMTVQEAKEKFKNIDFIVISLQRHTHKETVIPRGDTVFHSFDQVYFSVPNTSLDNLNQLIGNKKSGVKDVMILGGGKIGRKAGRILCQQKRNVKIIESSRDKCFEIANELPEALVLQSDGRDVEVLEEESIGDMDALIAVTGHTETNIMTCLLAKSKGVKKTIALVENSDYINISQTIGVDTLINKKLLAANAIFKHVRKGTVVAVANLHNINAEVMEFLVRRPCKITEKPIKKLKLPRKSVVGGVIRDGKPLMTFGDFNILTGDRVLMFCLPEAVDDVEDLFN